MLCVCVVSLERQICVDRSEGLALRGPVGKELYNPGHTVISFQLILRTHTPHCYAAYVPLAQALGRGRMYGAHLYGFIAEVFDVLRAYVERRLASHQEY